MTRLLNFGTKRWNRAKARRIRMAPFVFLFSIGCCAIPLMTQAANSLPAAWQQKVLALSWSKGQSSFKFDRGYVLSFRRTVAEGPQKDTIHLNSLSDGMTKDLPFWINGASQIWIDAVAVVSEQKFIVVGSFLPIAGGQPINFMAETDIEGRHVQTVDMGTYEPEFACAASDGSVWTLGQDWSAEQSDISYPMLRNYLPNGRLLDSYLVNDSLPPIRLNFSRRLHRMGGASGGTYLRCGDESVGVYLGPAFTWAEVQLKNKTFQTWKVQFPASGHVTGLALLGTHEVYCSFATRKSVIVRGLFKLDLRNSDTADWEPIDGTLTFVGESALSSPVTFVAGSDGPNLVYVNMPTDFPKSDPVFFWSKPE